MSRSLLAAAVTAVLVAGPAVAAACPSCAGNGQSTNGQLLSLAAFVAFPFVMLGGVIFATWRVSRVR